MDKYGAPTSRYVLDKFINYATTGWILAIYGGFAYSLLTIIYK